MQSPDWHFIKTEVIAAIDETKAAAVMSVVNNILSLHILKCQIPVLKFAKWCSVNLSWADF